MAELREALRVLAEADNEELEAMLRWAPEPYRRQLQRALARTEPTPIYGAGADCASSSASEFAEHDPDDSSFGNRRCFFGYLFGHCFEHDPGFELDGNRCRRNSEFVPASSYGKFAEAAGEGEWRRLGCRAEGQLKGPTTSGATVRATVPADGASSAELAHDAHTSGLQEPCPGLRFARLRSGQGFCTASTRCHGSRFARRFARLRSRQSDGAASRRGLSLRFAKLRSGQGSRSANSENAASRLPEPPHATSHGLRFPRLA